MNQNTIGRKIRIIGILFIFLMTIIIATTTYLSSKNKKDALVINIAGKERMLTQRISKNIFYLYHNKDYSFSELDSATLEFIYNLNSLKDGNNLIGIFKAPTDKIAEQISKVEILWNSFYNNINRFKELLLIRNQSNEKELKNIVNTVYETNNKLLEEVDRLVSMYTIYTESKTEYIKYMQYFFAFTIIFLIIYSIIQLKAMEENARKFLEYSKKLVETSGTQPLEPIRIEAEEEIKEATDTINCFINKVNSAVEYSTSASKKLEEITAEFDEILDELNNNTNISSQQLNKSEDMVIESQEELINSSKKLQDLKKQLDSLINNCKTQA
ncbi:type IV pili methyl-accepting chemotaxis transducer N-terminal domain-containing protein [Arcobacter sp. YIC-310]|uniref:type IV pili methyl-accepting chemotaxis transducer N-terminal domain-containing protein n=1 Tax=Arcobacter sp. YIC-310 TaxID=3376632 RepID=UPI003C2A2D01